MHLVLKLSKLCNLRCTYCYEFEHLADARRMPLHGLERLFQGIAEWVSEQAYLAPVEFALHGGEPLLLPHSYLRELVSLQQKVFSRAGIPFRNGAQTNLYRVSDATLDLCEELGIRLGISLDVSGNQRQDAQGRCIESEVQARLTDLVASGRTRTLGLNGISVLHRGNYQDAVQTFKFFADLGLDYRILPYFNLTSEPGDNQLALAPDQINEALMQVFRARLSHRGKPIRILPLDEHLDTAMRFTKQTAPLRRPPPDTPWALICNTDGTLYTHADAYSDGKALGNAFVSPSAFTMALRSDAYRNSIHDQQARTQTCRRCEFERHCSQLPCSQALPSERSRSSDGQLDCVTARPLTAAISSLLGQSHWAAATRVASA